MSDYQKAQEEQSKRVFWVIQTVFSLLLAKSLVEYKDCILDPLSPKYSLQTLGLVLVYGTVLWSWIDYSYSTVVSPYIFNRGRFEKWRFAVDLLIVICYSYLLFSLEPLSSNKTASIQGLFNGFVVIFVLYVVSGILRIAQYGRRASRIWLIGIFVALYSALAYLYGRDHNGQIDSETWNIVFVCIAIVLMIAYRWTRTVVTRRPQWIAVDVDGILANQVLPLLPKIAAKFGVDLKYENVTEWDLPLANTDIATLIRDEQKSKEYILSLPTIAGASIAMNKLIKKYKVAIVTARPPESDPWTKQWLIENDIPYDDYFNQKEGTKQNIAAAVSLLIDDYQKNIEEFLSNSNGAAILYSQPWNGNRDTLHDYIAKGRLVVVDNWEEVVSTVRRLTRNSRRY